MYGNAYGGEWAAEWHLPHGRGRLRAAHSYLKIDLHLRPGANPENETRGNGSPKHQSYVQYCGHFFDFERIFVRLKFVNDYLSTSYKLQYLFV